MRQLKTNARLNGSIELLRFISAYYIAIEHFTLKLPGGLPVVDTFFLLAGYFQMRHMMRSEDFSPFRYTWQRFAGMAFLYESSIVLLNLFGEAGISLRNFVGGMYRSIPDMFCLQMSGLSELHVNSPLWFVAGMMIAGMFLALLFAMNRKVFTYALPMIAILGYASIFHLQGDMDATYYPNFAYPATYVVPLGTVRALAGMAVGCMMHLFVESHGEMLADRKNMPLLTVTEVVTGVIILYGFLFNHHNHSDFIYVILLPIFLVCVCSRNTLWGPLTNRAGQVLDAVFGRQYTLAVFCLQIFAIRVYQMIFGKAFEGRLGIAVLVYAVILTVISVVFTRLADVFNKKFIR